MNRNFVVATVLAAGLTSSTFAASALQAQAASPATAPASAAPPQAIPAKIAVIAFEQVVIATNEGQRAVADVQKKYEPKKAQIESESNEVESLKKQVQALPATTSDDERTNRYKAIDVKEKQLQRDAEDAQNSYNNDLQEAIGKVAQKVGGAAVKYSQDNGFTLMVNVSAQQQAPSPLMWWQPSTDISQAVVNAYNTSSGVAAPPPSAPAPARRTTPPAAAPKK